MNREEFLATGASSQPKINLKLTSMEPIKAYNDEVRKGIVTDFSGKISNKENLEVSSNQDYQRPQTKESQRNYAMSPLHLPIGQATPTASATSMAKPSKRY